MLELSLPKENKATGGRDCVLADAANCCIKCERNGAAPFIMLHQRVKERWLSHTENGTKRR
jgi:hypothetical protein